MIRMTGPPDAVLRSWPARSLCRCAADCNLCQSQPRRVYMNGTETDSSSVVQTLSGFWPRLMHQRVVLGASLADPRLGPVRSVTHPVAGDCLQRHLSQHLGVGRPGVAQFTAEPLHRLPRPLETQLPR